MKDACSAKCGAGVPAKLDKLAGDGICLCQTLDECKDCVAEKCKNVDLTKYSPCEGKFEDTGPRKVIQS